MGVTRFSRETLERLAIVCAQAPLSTQSLGELLESVAPNGARWSPESVSELTTSVPPGLHAIIAMRGLGQFELAWFVVLSMAVSGRRGLVVSLERNTPRVLAHARAQERVQRLGPELAQLPIQVLEAPALGVEDVVAVVDRHTPDILIVDSFDRLVPSHIDELAHFARHHDAIVLAALASQHRIPILVTTSLSCGCDRCGGPSSSVRPGVRNEPSGIALEADYTWSLNRDSYWCADGDDTLTVTGVGRDGSSFELQVPTRWHGRSLCITSGSTQS